MSIDFIRPEVDELRPRISVIGVGGAGGNAIANMIKSDVQGVDFIVANTDAQALNASSTDRRSSSVSRSPKASAPDRGPRSAAPPPKRRSRKSNARSMARTCASSPPAWAGEPAPAPRR